MLLLRLVLIEWWNGWVLIHWPWLWKKSIEYIRLGKYRPIDISCMDKTHKTACSRVSLLKRGRKGIPGKILEEGQNTGMEVRSDDDRDFSGRGGRIGGALLASHSSECISWHPVWEFVPLVVLSLLNYVWVISLLWVLRINHRHFLPICIEFCQLPEPHFFFF